MLVRGLIATLSLMSIAAGDGSPAPPRAENHPQAFLATRGSTHPEDEVVYHWTGTIHASVPVAPLAEPERTHGEPLLRFEGYNIARFLPIEGTDQVRMLSREVGVYQDPATGTILDCWTNPWTGAEVPVVHVYNDPVNGTFGDVASRQLGDQLVWSFEFSLAYPSPLPVDEFGPYSAGNTYQSTEVFDFVASLDAFDDPTTASVPATMTWTRVGQWLPWMQMGQRPGSLVYHAVGRKLPGGWDDLPESLRTFVSDHAPAFSHAPAADDGSPNATTWSVFRDLVRAGEYVPECAAPPANPES